MIGLIEYKRPHSDRILAVPIIPSQQICKLMQPNVHVTIRIKHAISGHISN